MRVEDEINRSIVSYAELLGRLSRIADAIKELGLSDMDAYCLASPNYGEQPPDVAISLYEGYLSEVARLILPKVGKINKSFHEENNQIQLGTEYKGIRFSFSATPPSTCIIEKVEEEVEVPEKVVPAHKERKVRYKMVGDCDPLMQAPAQAAIPDAFETGGERMGVL